MEKLSVYPENASRFADWIANRGGVAQWSSVDLSDPGASVSTPALADGQPTGKPGWKYANEPSDIITSTDDIVVTVPREVDRFHVAVRMGSQGFKVKLTDASSAKLRKRVAKHGENAWHEFDYTTQEAVIFVPDSEVSLTEWLTRQPAQV